MPRQVSANHIPDFDQRVEKYKREQAHERAVREEVGASTSSGIDIRPQPEPIENTLGAVWDQVIEDMEQRNEAGVEKYGTPLQPFNGRDALVDAYQEVLDCAVYLKQRIAEDKLRSVELPTREELLKAIHIYCVSCSRLSEDSIAVGTQPEDCVRRSCVLHSFRSGLVAIQNPHTEG
jgi:hypothetical protein